MAVTHPRKGRNGKSVPIASGVVAALAAANSAEAATFNVTSLGDAGPGTLRQAIADANATAGADVITFQPGLTGTITLTSGQLDITDSLDIQGPGQSALTVSGNNASRVFYLYNLTEHIAVTISDLTITEGLIAGGGGGIINWDEDLTLDSVIITENTAVNGAGLWSDGANVDLTIRNSIISGNDSGCCGGGIYSGDSATVLIEDSVITGNTAAAAGGGIYFYDPDGDVTIRRTTISNNQAGAGGGIYLYDTDGGTFSILDSTISGNEAEFAGGITLYSPDGPVVIRNTTISGNQAAYAGGVAFYYTGAGVTLDFVTIANNTATTDVGGVFTAGTVTVTNSIIADNTAPTFPDTFTYLDGNFEVSFSLIETPGGTINDNGDNIFNDDPELGPLQDNGGPTETHIPALTSPVLDEADPATAVTTDQRGEPRESGIAPDMGAVEIDGGTVVFDPVVYSIAENGGSVTLTLTRSGGSDPATVDYTFANGTATGGSDFNGTVGTATFAAGATSTTINVPILDDALFEGSETFTVTLGAPSPGATIGAAGTATVTITDCEPGQLQFSAPTYSVDENGSGITVNVTRTNGSCGEVTVDYSTIDNTATAGADYTANTGSLVWVDGDTGAKDFNVPILDDTLVEGTESFYVVLTNPTGGATSGADSIVNIQDVEPGTLQFQQVTYTIGETGANLVVTVTRTNGSTGAVSVDFATANGTATAGSDYDPTSGTLSWDAGDTVAKTIIIPIFDDAIVEGSETFTITLSNPQGDATIGANNSATATITDVEPGMLLFSSPTYSANENGGNLIVTVTRTNGTSGSVSADYATANGSATAGSDYTATSGTVTFGDTDAMPQTISIPILDDTLVEGAETFTIVLTNLQGGAVAGANMSATNTIIDVESGSLQFSSPTYSVDENGGSLLVTVTRTGGTTGSVSADYATANGSATSGADYTATSGTVTFAAGNATPQTISIPILDDTLVEGPETFTIALSNFQGGAVAGANSTATVTINDIEAGTLQFSSPTYAIDESGASLLVTVTRTGGTTGSVSADYATANGSATAGADYTATSGTVTFAAGSATPQTISIPILDDALPEGPETFTIALTNLQGGAVAGANSTATNTINDIEAGTLQFSSPTYAVDENGGSLVVTVTRAGGTTGSVSADYATSDGSAITGADYTAVSGTVTFAAGDATLQTIPIPILDDTLVEGAETFTIALTNLQGGAVAGANSSATNTINDIEPGEVTFLSATYEMAEGGGSLLVTVQRNGGSTGAVSVDYATSDGTATAGADYTATSGTLNWADGDAAAKTFSVPLISDAVAEGDETFTITLSGVTGGAVITPHGTTTVSITDEPAGTAQFSTGTVTTSEDGGNVTLTVTRTGGSNGSLTINYATANGTATGGQDFTPTSGSITFEDGETAPQTIVIPILNDAAFEPDETFTITLSSPTAGAVGDPATATITIQANDAAALEPIPALDGFGKLMMMLGAALAGLFVIGRGRLWGILFCLLFIGVSAQPLSAQMKPEAAKQAKQAKKKAKEEKPGKSKGVLAGVVVSEGHVTLTLQGGGSVTVPAAKLRVVDMRTAGRKRATVAALAAGQQVVIRTANKNGRVQVRIVG